MASIYVNAGISDNLASVTKQKLAKADMEIRWLKHKKLFQDKVAQKVEEVWTNKLEQLIAEKGFSKKEVENLSTEVHLMHLLLDGIDGTPPADAARQLGHTGKPQYSYARHIDGDFTFDVARLTEMRAFTLLRFGEDKRQAFDTFMEHVAQTKNLDIEKITKAAEKLQEIIDTSIGIKEFDRLIAGNNDSKPTFTSLLAKKVLEGKSAELIKEVLLMRVLLDGIDGYSNKAARQRGHTGNRHYSYVRHIDGAFTFDAVRLTEMRVFTLLRFGKKEEVMGAFDAFMNHVAQTENLDIEKITEAAEKLQEITVTSIGIKERDVLLKGNSGAGSFTQLLAKAVLENKSAELIKEVLLMRLLLDGIDGTPQDAARQFGHTGEPKYSYVGHIDGDFTFDVERLTEMRAFTLLRFGEDKRQAFDAFMNHVVQTKNLDMEKITASAKKLQEIIATSIGIKELDKLIAGKNNGKHPFTQLLAEAVLEGKPAELIKEVILMRMLTSAMQILTGEKGPPTIARSLGVKGQYTFKAHLGVGYADMEKAEAISNGFSTKISQALKNGEMEKQVNELTAAWQSSEDDSLQQAVADMQAALQGVLTMALLQKGEQAVIDMQAALQGVLAMALLQKGKQAVVDMQDALQGLKKLHPSEEVIATEKYEQMKMFDLEEAAGF